MERILLHACCGPCALYPVEVLREEGLEPLAFWSNPNIHPEAEYALRREAFVLMAGRSGLDTLFDEEDGWSGAKGWFETTRPGWVEGDKERRCGLCYEMRLRRAVRTAREKGIGKFTTTLLYSRYQYHELIAEICCGLATESGVEFVYRDFRKGWNRGIELSKKMGLYRQRYCGCIFSTEERGK